MHDETRYARIAPRFGGWVRKLHVNFTGAPVEKGQPLFTVYSPELFSTENEYLIAWRGLQQLKADAPAEQRNTAANLLASARRRLELWEIGDDEIRALEQRGTASDEMLFRSPITGHVVTKTAVEGKSFMAGESLYEVADLVASLAGRLGLRVRSAPDEAGPAGRRSPSPIWATRPSARRSRSSIRTSIPRRGAAASAWSWTIPNTCCARTCGPASRFKSRSAKSCSIPASAVIDTGQRFVAFVEGEDEHLAAARAEGRLQDR